MRINPDKLSPSQDFLKPQTLRYIANCILDGREDELPPAPIVRQDENDKLIVIDGHNLVAAMYLCNRDVDIVVVKDGNDYVANETDAGEKRRQELILKFESSLDEQKRVASEGITSFADLVDKYPDETAQLKS